MEFAETSLPEFESSKTLWIMSKWFNGPSGEVMETVFTVSWSR